jgi:hypothetical protein
VVEGIEVVEKRFEFEFEYACWILSVLRFSVKCAQ